MFEGCSQGNLNIFLFEMMLPVCACVCQQFQTRRRLQPPDVTPTGKAAKFFGVQTPTAPPSHHRRMGTANSSFRSYGQRKGPSTVPRRSSSVASIFYPDNETPPPVPVGISTPPTLNRSRLLEATRGHVLDAHSGDFLHAHRQRGDIKGKRAPSSSHGPSSSSSSTRRGRHDVNALSKRAHHHRAQSLTPFRGLSSTPVPSRTPLAGAGTGGRAPPSPLLSSTISAYARSWFTGTPGGGGGGGATNSMGSGRYLL